VHATNIIALAGTRSVKRSKVSQYFDLSSHFVDTTLAGAEIEGPPTPLTSLENFHLTENKQPWAGRRSGVAPSVR